MQATNADRAQDHILFHTRYKRDVILNYETFGRGPAMPDKAINHFTPWIMRNCASNDRAVLDHAAKLVDVSFAELDEKLGEYAIPYFEYEEKVSALTGRIYTVGTQRTEQNLRRTLRKAFKQANEQTAHIFMHVRSNGEKYVSATNLDMRRKQIQKQQEWIKSSAMSTTRTDAETGEVKKFKIPLESCIRTAAHQFNERYAFVKGQETVFVNKGFIPLFITITTPAEYHPHPAKGRCSWDGSSVADSHRWFTHKWNKTRAFLKKHDILMEGVRVVEPHQDGSEHWHVLVYAKHDEIGVIKNAIQMRFGHSSSAVKFKQDFLKPSKDGKKASAASYLMKYILKTIRADGDSIDYGTEAADAWRTCWMLRGLQFFGIVHGKIGLWRELRRLEKRPDDDDAARLWRAARGTRAAQFIGLFMQRFQDAYTVRELTPVMYERSTNELKGYKKGRVKGFYAFGTEYLTHEDRWTIETKVALHNSLGASLNMSPPPASCAACGPRWGLNVSENKGEERPDALNRADENTVVSIMHSYPREADGTDITTPQDTHWWLIHPPAAPRAGQGASRRAFRPTRALRFERVPRRGAGRRCGPCP